MPVSLTSRTIRVTTGQIALKEHWGNWIMSFDMNKKNILVIEDEADIAELLLLHLNDIAAHVQVCVDGVSGLQTAREQRWDLVVLDLRLPGLDGLDVCRRLRAEGNNVPILMLTAKTSELDRVLGLEVGADDYVLKPFSVMEVMARIRALLRRVSLEREVSHDLQVIHAGELRVDEAKRTVSMGDAGQGKVIDLPPREFDLLVFFMRAPGKVFRRTALLDQVWGYGHEGYEHTVNSHINRLRAKLCDADPANDYIVTVWGVGYKFNELLAGSDYAA